MALLYKCFSVSSMCNSVKSAIFSKAGDNLRLYQNVKNTCGRVLFLVKLQAKLRLKNIHLPGN